MSLSCDRLSKKLNSDLVDSTLSESCNFLDFVSLLIPVLLHLLNFPKWYKFSLKPPKMKTKKISKKLRYATRSLEKADESSSFYCSNFVVSSNRWYILFQILSNFIKNQVLVDENYHLKAAELSAIKFRFRSKGNIANCIARKGHQSGYYENREQRWKCATNYEIQNPFRSNTSCSV